MSQACMKLILDLDDERCVRGGCKLATESVCPTQIYLLAESPNLLDIYRIWLLLVAATRLLINFQRFHNTNARVSTQSKVQLLGSGPLTKARMLPL